VTARGTSELLAIPNLLSISRALLVIPFAAVMLSSRPDARFWGAAIIVAAAITDKLDGLLARRFGEETEWGRILDPLADKVAAGSVALVLLVLNQIPLWFVLAVLGRDLLIVAGGMYAKARTGVILPSNETGKWAMGVLTAALFALVVNAPRWVGDMLMTAGGIMLAVSLFLYASRFRKVMKESLPG